MNLTILSFVRSIAFLVLFSCAFYPAVKVRGLAKGPIVDKDFFIIMDRLHGTLDQKINTWYHEEKRHKGTVLGLGKNRKLLRELMIERMTVSYDLAAAFFYLHENRLVYRDIKPENIGFDIRGDVKVFDFGLCKSLSSKLKARGDGYGYRLTGRAGSRALRFRFLG